MKCIQYIETSICEIRRKVRQFEPELFESELLSSSESLGNVLSSFYCQIIILNTNYYLPKITSYTRKRFLPNFRAYDDKEVSLFLRGHTMVLLDRGDLIKSTSVSAGYLTGEKACRLSSLHSHIVSKVHHTW